MVTLPHLTPIRIIDFGDGRRGYARDRDGYPEHAVYVDGHVRWVPHEEGAFISPYLGPLSAILETPPL